ncbi:glycoside hydrolase family 15 protein [Nanoarchaeota archaeon]
MTLDYGIIGNCRTAALISKTASLDWCCFPKFDDPSVFAKLLDNKKGGSFEILPIEKYTIKQEYQKNTNILETTFSNKKSKFKIIDFFIRYKEPSEEKARKDNRLYRLIKVLKGNPEVKIIFNPKLDYARGKTTLKLAHNALMSKNKKQTLFLHSSLDVSNILKKKPITLKNNDYLILSFGEECKVHNSELVTGLLDKTIDYWKTWVNRSTWPKFYREKVVRATLALKLLTYDETGAVVAAPTTSIPEELGKGRNWDYRFCWLRDSSFTINALTRVCHFDAALRYLGFLKRALLNKKGEKPNLQAVYGIDGSKNLNEKVLKHLSGYKNSKPVRIGNVAYKQKQLDSAGEAIYTIHEFYVHYRYKKELDEELWKLVQDLADYILHVWRQKDHGIWEFRKTQKHFTFSKMMAWVALDKAIEIAKFFKKKLDISKWEETRELIKQDILEKAFNKKKQAFTMSYKSDELDASILLMPYYDFINPKFGKMKTTIAAIEKELATGCLMKRYKKDESGESKNAFLICSFWLIDALYLSGNKKKAKALFRRVLNYGNHLGLFSEDINPRTGELLGNFPQAYTHIALINSAVLLSGKGMRRPTCKIAI